MKCHWCQKDLETVNEDHPEYLECPDTHALITLDKSKIKLDPDTLVYDSLEQAINEYIIYHDIENVRYKITGYNGPPNFTSKPGTRLYKKVGSLGYKEQLVIKYLPLKLKEDTIQMEPILKKLRKLVIFS